MTFEEEKKKTRLRTKRK